MQVWHKFSQTRVEGGSRCLRNGHITGLCEQVTNLHWYQL